jgi:hypothetical protein
VAEADSLLPEPPEFSELVEVSVGLLSLSDLDVSLPVLLEPFSAGGLGRP